MRTLALYHVPKDGEMATRFDDQIFTVMVKARKARKHVCNCGTEVALHVGEEHPDPLPFGETLWREISSK